VKFSGLARKAKLLENLKPDTYTNLKKMELHKQAEELKNKGIKRIREGRIKEGADFLLKAAEKLEKAAEFSEGIAKDIRLKRAEDFRKFAKERLESIERENSLPEGLKKVAGWTLSVTGSSIGGEVAEPKGATAEGTASRALDYILRRQDIGGKGIIILPIDIVNFMEVRVESSFRTHQKDVETLYALSGSDPNIPDMIHTHSSQEVIKDVSPTEILFYRRQIVEYIRRERSESSKLIVDLHTHPDGIPESSDADKEAAKDISEEMNNVFPGGNLVFGVHAVSSEGEKERKEPVKTDTNRIKWSSVIREHEVGFYNEESESVEVHILYLK
jgi:hypothetical protein